MITTLTELSVPKYCIAWVYGRVVQGSVFLDTLVVCVAMVAHFDGGLGT